jgi:hypothetical protein
MVNLGHHLENLPNTPLEYVSQANTNPIGQNPS